MFSHLTQYQLVMDRQTDKQTDRHRTIAYTMLTQHCSKNITAKARFPSLWIYNGRLAKYVVNAHLEWLK